jgi:hypothetical protein
VSDEPRWLTAVRERLGPTPVGTYHDVREAKTFPISEPFRAAYSAWLTAHGVDPNETVRAEHHVIDAPLVRVFQYDRDEHGCRYTDPATNRVAMREPFDVLITTPPPSPEDYA